MKDSGWHPAMAEMELGKVLAALADPMRRQVVLDLAAGPDVPRLCSTFAMPVAKATRTHHFRVLRETGLIRQVDLGNGRTNVLRRAELDQRFPGLIAAVLAAERQDAARAAAPPHDASAPAQMEASSSGGAITPDPSR